MEWNLLSRILREIREAGTEEIGLFYISEPFFKPQRLVRSIEFCAELGFPYIFVTTNGSLATPHNVERAMAAGLNSLKFSINFSDDEQFSKVTGRPSRNYQWALENLASAKKIRDEKGYDCGVFASSIQFTGEQQKRMERIIEEKVLPHVDEHYWLPLYSFGGADVGVGKPIAGNQGRIGALRDGLPCWSLWEGHIRSSPDGQRAYLSACCFGSDDKFDIADLTETSFVEAWNSKAFQDLRKAHISRDVKGTMCEACLAYS
jgi:MoaA/NifB/PqqE/SkfB family radical SAM enzyme